MGTQQQSLLVRAGTAATAAAVSSAVYAGLTSTGDFTASLVGRGIGMGGVLLGSGADYLVGHSLGNGFRVLGFIGENSVRPLLSTGTRTFALGASVVAGTVTQLALPVVLEMPSFLGTVAIGTGKYIYTVGKQAAERWLPARYIPTPADSDDIVEAFAGLPRIQGIVRYLPIAAQPGSDGFQAVSPLQAAEVVAAAPWEVIASHSEASTIPHSFTARAEILAEDIPRPAFCTSGSESQTPHLTPDADAEDAPESPKEAGAQIL